MNAPGRGTGVEGPGVSPGLRPRCPSGDGLHGLRRRVAIGTGAAAARAALGCGSERTGPDDRRPGRPVFGRGGRPRPPRAGSRRRGADRRGADRRGTGQDADTGAGRPTAVTVALTRPDGSDATPAGVTGVQALDPAAGLRQPGPRAPIRRPEGRPVRPGGAPEHLERGQSAQPCPEVGAALARFPERQGTRSAGRCPLKWWNLRRRGRSGRSVFGRPPIGGAPVTAPALRRAPQGRDTHAGLVGRQ